ncbi:hypothetical protein FXO37_29629 [Capsicum annuum]|nr:hypothetical protein FXO37_29629 [Capsicum annuum]
MSISLEALAMMGVDYVKDGISLEEFEEHEEQVPPYLLLDDDQEDYDYDDEKFFSRKKNIHQENPPTRKLYEHSFSSQEFFRKFENHDELLAPVLHFVSMDRGEKGPDEGKKKKPLIKNQINFWELLKKKDLASILETSRNNHCIIGESVAGRLAGDDGRNAGDDGRNAGVAEDGRRDAGVGKVERASTSTANKRSFSASTTTLLLYLVAKWRICCRKTGRGIRRDILPGMGRGVSPKAMRHYTKCTVHFEDTKEQMRSERTPQYLLADESDGGNHDHGQLLGGQARRWANNNVQAEATASANVKPASSLGQKSCTCQ